MSSVLIQDVTKSYGATQVMHGVSVDIPDRSFVALVGPSGCGKSTLLRMLAGLESISSGSVFIGDRRVNDVEPKDRDIAMVFQNYALYPQMTVAQNMGFSLEMARVPKAEAERRVQEAAGVLGLEPLLGRYPRQLSGGQRQRVAMGRAIVRNPQVFLFDEPLSNLDAALRVQMRAEIKALQRRLGTTTVYVTHDQIEAMTMADLIVVLRDGRVEQVGPPLTLFDRPANRFVAGFIGSPAMNQLSGQLSDDGRRFTTAHGAVLHVGPTSRVAHGRRVVLGLRPEHLMLGSEGDGCAAIVEVVEPTGSETMLAVRPGGEAGRSSAVLGESESDRLIHMVIRSRVDLQPGQRIHVDARRAPVHCFDPQTGLRLDD